MGKGSSFKLAREVEDIVRFRELESRERASEERRVGRAVGVGRVGFEHIGKKSRASTKLEGGARYSLTLKVQRGSGSNARIEA